jgi:hypothetical protein
LAGVGEKRLAGVEDLTGVDDMRTGVPCPGGCPKQSDEMKGARILGDWVTEIVPKKGPSIGRTRDLVVHRVPRQDGGTKIGNSTNLGTYTKRLGNLHRKEGRMRSRVEIGRERMDGKGTEAGDGGAERRS